LGTTFNKSKSNISPEEPEALQTLIELQKQCKIIIKPCDKEVGIKICDFDKYLDSCYEHLSINITMNDQNQPYHQKVTLLDLKKAKDKIKIILKKDTKEISSPSLKKDQESFTNYSNFTKNTQSPIYLLAVLSSVVVDQSLII
jgi:hypothetical protein